MTRESGALQAIARFARISFGASVPHTRRRGRITVVQDLAFDELTGHFVRLERLSLPHYEALRIAARDAALWTYMPIVGDSDFGRWLAVAEADMQKGDRVAFAVRRLSDGAILGSTSYLAIVPAHRRVEIGWTWYVAEVQGTVVNPEAKFLLLEHAFERAEYNRVEFKTDSRNARSRAALRKLGAKEEGVLRQHMWMPRGYWRDSVYYSILREEWPEVARALRARIAPR
jgi:N-acetyltransferase